MRILIVDDIKGWRDYHSYVVSGMLDDVEIVEADSARAGYDLLLQYNDTPFDVILTDMQMENDFEPKYAGEWFIEQIKTFKNYKKTKVVAISAAYNLKMIAENLGVESISKSTARNFPEVYDLIRN